MTREEAENLLNESLGVEPQESEVEDEYPLIDEGNDEKFQIYYEVSKETPNVRGSGSTFDYVARTDSFEEARRLLLKHGRNRLERITITNGKKETRVWDDGRWETTLWS